jgi:putative PIN family toxin of toxin-antitoxin system
MASQDKLRVVIDTNWWVSATINSISRKKIYRILSSHHIQLLYSRKLFDEFCELIKREKFRKLVLFSKAERFISLALPMMIEIADSNKVSNVRDVKDVFICRCNYE